MVKIRLWKVFFLLFEVILDISASTHWVVTENGRIQSHLDSPFHLRRPFDLMALLDQETRRTDIGHLYQDLVSRKNTIDQKWTGLEGASDLETRVYTENPDCLKAGKLLSEIDLYTSVASNGTDREGIQLELNEDVKEKELFIPNCSEYSKLDFSMFAFEHLPAMVNRKNVTFSSETDLGHLLPLFSIPDFGHQIALGLMKNSSSWLHYNLAIIYWRMQGDGPKAIECGRRAIHFVPRQYRDIPLLNVAGIFHQSRNSKEAAILLHAAIDHAPYQATNYLALGNVYAALGEYNRSLACYDNLLKLQPDMEDIFITKHATLCHQHLEDGLMDLHEALQEILAELHDYHTQQQQWLRLQERLIWEQAPFDAQLSSYNTEKLNSLLTQRGQRCIQRISEDAKPTITCDFTNNQLAPNLQMDVTLNLKRLLHNVESETQKISEQMAKKKQNQKTVINDYQDSSKQNDYVESILRRNEESESNMPSVLHPKFPTSLTTSSNLYFDETGWPSKEDCTKWNLPAIKENDLNIPIFLPPENKGFQISQILSEYINISHGSEHELPWYPPVCKNSGPESEKLYLPAALHQLMNIPLKTSSLLHQHLLKYVNDGKTDEREIGQRINTAMKKKAGPEWVLAILASVYWRVRSNTKNALACLDLAFHAVSKEHTDVILVSIGSILQQLGLVDDSIKFATLAFKVNYVEPSTNFLLAILHYKKNNPILAMYYMKNVIRVDPNYYDGKAEALLKAWACKVKNGKYEDFKTKSEKNEGMCGEKDVLNGEGVICSANGEQCKTAAIQCFRADSITDRDSKPISKVISSQQCAKHKVGLGQSLISTLLAAEGSGGSEPDQSQLESMIENPQQAFHMRISLGDDHTSGSNTLGDFYVSVSLSDDPIPEAMLHVYDKSGTYPLSPHGCKDIRDADWLHFTSMWQSIAARNIDIGPFLKPLHDESTKPYCSDVAVPSSSTLDHLTSMILRKKLPSSPENALSEWLGLMAGDQEASLRELGSKIGIALKENTRSWILATAGALYWRVVGNTEQAITCLRQALAYVPGDMKDIPLISLANVLHRVGFHSDALEVAYEALKSHPNFVVNHFTVGNIHTSMGDLEKAISFYRSSLALDANFEPARNRLQAILCTLLFDDSGSLRETTDVNDN